MNASLQSPQGCIMRKPLVFLAGTILTVCVHSASAGEKFPRTYAEQTKQKKQIETKTEQTLTLAGMDIDTKSTLFSIATITSGKRDTDGNLTLEESIDVLQTDLSLPGGLTVQFDSANPDKAADNAVLEPLLDMLRATFKNPVTMTVDRDNHVQDLKFANNPEETLPKEVRGFLDPVSRKKSAEQAWGFLPDRAVAIGDQWERTEEHNLGGGQSLTYKSRYTYAGPEKLDGQTYQKFDVERLEASYSLDPNANPMVQVPKSDLKVAKSSGVILYQPETGAVAKREAEVKIAGTLTLVINGQELPGELDLSITEKSNLLK
ncbi:MAG: hypothetical protein U0872_05480 [Planctomycetaceae bacterium]